MSLDYAYEKLSVAVASMATSIDSLQERLANAYIYGLHPINQGDLPSDLQSSFRKIKESLTKVPAQADEGNVVATTRAMSDEDARKLIEQIVDLYDEVAQLIGRQG